MANGDDSDGGNRTVLQNGVRYLGLIVQVLQTSFPQITGTSAAANAGGATLPANPEGFITVVLPATGETVKVPYYLE